MSMNLVCEEAVLIQTPTHITRMCLYADLEEHTKSPWKTVMEKYLLWVTETWGNKLQRWDFVDQERSKLIAAAQRYGKLTFKES